MPHRADQIIDAAVAALQANAALVAAVYPHRLLSLSELDGEVPAVCVNFGADTPDDELLGLSAMFYSNLELEVTTYATGAEEADVRRALLELRRQVHVGLMANTRLGLEFVHLVFYAGASRPEFAVTETFAGALTSLWRVRYEMSMTDPAA